MVCSTFMTHDIVKNATFISASHFCFRLSSLKEASPLPLAKYAECPVMLLAYSKMRSVLTVRHEHNLNSVSRMAVLTY